MKFQFPSDEETMMLNIAVDDLFHSKIFESVEKYKIEGFCFTHEKKVQDDFVVIITTNPKAIYIYKTMDDYFNLLNLILGNMQYVATVGRSCYIISEDDGNAKYLKPKNWNSYLKKSLEHPRSNRRDIIYSRDTIYEGINVFSKTDVTFLFDALTKLRSLYQYYMKNKEDIDEYHYVTAQYVKDTAYVDVIRPMEFDYFTKIEAFKFSNPAKIISSIENAKESDLTAKIGYIRFIGVKNNDVTDGEIKKDNYLQMFYLIDEEHHFDYVPFYTSDDQAKNNITEAIIKLINKTAKYKTVYTNNQYISMFYERFLKNSEIYLDLYCMREFESHFLNSLYTEESELKEELSDIFGVIDNYDFDASIDDYNHRNEDMEEFDDDASDYQEELDTKYVS